MTEKRLLVTICIFAVLAFLPWNIALSAPTGGGCCGDFRELLMGGDVEVDYLKAGAVLGDDGYQLSYLFDFNELVSGWYYIDFDVKNVLSATPYPPSAPPFAFLDTFYASLLFRDDKGLPDCVTCYDWLPLFDLDANGVFNNFGIISSSPEDLEGDGWFHFRMAFENTHPYVIPGFELVDWNVIDNDSQVHIANTCISQVPLPASVALLGSGLLGLVGLSRPRKNLGSKKVQKGLPH